MTDSGERRHFALWHLQAMYDRKPADTALHVRVRHVDGFQIKGRVIDIDKNTLTVRSDTGMILENVLPEHIDHAEII